MVGPGGRRGVRHPLPLSFARKIEKDKGNKKEGRDTKERRSKGT